VLDAHLADGSTVAFEADPVTTAQEIVDMVLAKKAVSERSGYALTMTCEGSGPSPDTHTRAGGLVLTAWTVCGL
jgi:hypothetical protein